MGSIVFQSKYGEGHFDVIESALEIGEHSFPYPIYWKERPGRLYIIFSTECNLRCSYCFQNGLNKMAADVELEKLYEHINFFKNKIQEIVLFGGEPLLESNYKMISSVLDRFDYLKFILFTNGNFNELYRKLIVQYSYCIQSVVITLDGPKVVHNRRRINPMQDSYETIIQNLKYLAQHEIVLDVQVNIDKNNADTIEMLFADIVKDSLLKGLDYTLNPVKYTQTALSYDTLLEIYFVLKEHFAHRIFLNNRLVINLQNLLNNKPLLAKRCALESTFVLSYPDNTVYACPQNPSSLTGYLCEGKVFLESEKISYMTLITQYKREKCSVCVFQHLCPYGCPYVPEGKDCVQKVEQLLKIACSHIDTFVDLSSHFSVVK